MPFFLLARNLAFLNYLLFFCSWLWFSLKLVWCSLLAGNSFAAKLAISRFSYSKGLLLLDQEWLLNFRLSGCLNRVPNAVLTFSCAIFLLYLNSQLLLLLFLLKKRNVSRCRTLFYIQFRYKRSYLVKCTFLLQEISCFLNKLAKRSSIV